MPARKARSLSLNKEEAMAPGILIGKSASQLCLLPAMSSRHGLVAGATGTGKTVTLKVLAEGFSSIGVPVFLSDVKGDLESISMPGAADEKLNARIQKLGLQNPEFKGFPVILWDLFGERGHPVRTTISEMGPLLLSRLLNLNGTQSGVLQIVFKFADDNGFLLLDLKDLRAMLSHVAEHAAEIKTEYGNVSSASIGAIQRSLLGLEEEGGGVFFGEPALNIDDFLQTDTDGRGFVSILNAVKLLHQPRIYSTFLLWLLSELFEHLPEAGDLEKPKLVFFFDEAHLLFEDAPKVLLDKIEQVVRLVRSRGVGIFFVTQSPLDISPDVLGQLGNRVQHAMRAFTEKDRKSLKAAADNFRANEKVDTLEALTQLEIGEALMSLLDEKGAPLPVERAFILPPQSRMGTLMDDERSKLIKDSLVAGHYEKSVDRISAFELLKERTERKSVETEDAAPAAEKKPVRSAPRPGRQTPMEAATVSAARAIGAQIGRHIIRGLLGSILGGRR